MRVIITLFVCLYPIIFDWLGIKIGSTPIEAMVYICNLSVVCMLNHVIYEIQKGKK